MKANWLLLLPHICVAIGFLAFWAALLALLIKYKYKKCRRYKELDTTPFKKRRNSVIWFWLTFEVVPQKDPAGDE